MKVNGYIMKKKRIIAALFLPSVLGITLFFIVPFLLTLSSSFKSDLLPGSKYHIKNYLSTITNPMFQLGVKNFLIFSIIALASTVILSLTLAIFLKKTGRNFLILFFSILLPFVIPSGSTAFFWNSIFGLNGAINRILCQYEMEIIMWDSSKWSILIPVFIYIWKFSGFFTLVFFNGLNNIPEEYYEIAKLEGAGEVLLFRKITLVFLTPTLMTVLFLSFIATFRISKEMFMLFGKYPNSNLYFIQHFINNQLANMNLPILSSATVIILVFIYLLMIPIWKSAQKTSDDFQKRGENNISTKRNLGKREFVIFFLISFVFLLPIIFTLSNSLMSTAEVVSRYSTIVTEQNIEDLSRRGLHFVNITLFPTHGTINQYIEFLRNPMLLRMFWNSVFIVSFVLIFQIPISVAASYAFWRVREKTNLFLILYIFLMIIPTQVLITPQYILFHILGIKDSYWPIVLPAIFNPIGVYIIRLQLQGFPRECIEAAQLDGADEIHILFKIVSPNIKASIVILAIYIFSEFWNIVDQAVVFIKSVHLLPLSVYLSNMLLEDIGIISSGSIIYMLPPCLMFVACLLWANQSKPSNILNGK